MATITSRGPASSDDTLAVRKEFVARGVASAHPVFASRALGARVWDTEGREYLDFAAGIGVLNVGHNHPRYVAAVRDQLESYSHTCFQVLMYEPYVELARRLAGLVELGTPSKTFFATTGAEAVENAIKIARSATGRPAVIAFDGAFHGRTLLGMTLTGMSEPYKQSFGPFAPEVYRAPYPYEYRGWSVERALDGLRTLFATTVAPDRVAAFVIECELGDGGFVPAPTEFMQELNRIADEHGILLICDEIQTGFGRTGRMFAFEHSEISPDMVVVGKALAGGLPLSAVVGRSEVMEAPEPGGLGGTFAGHPIACAAGLAVLDIIDEERLVPRAAELGETMRRELAAIQKAQPVVGDIRGLGTMLALEFVSDPHTREPDAGVVDRVLPEARQRGLLVIRCGIHRNVVRLLPPLVVSDADVRLGLRRLSEAIASAVEEARTLPWGTMQ